MSQDECGYDSAIPNMALLCHEPLDLYAIDTRAPLAYKDARSTRPDALGSSVRGRLVAKEHIIAEAINAKVQQYDPSILDKLTAGNLIDIWKEPNAKDKSGRIGSALNHFQKATPLKHLCPSIGF